jgi:hypothetical protein
VEAASRRSPEICAASRNRTELYRRNDWSRFNSLENAP